jgi:hypothetical protein
MWCMVILQDVTKKGPLNGSQLQGHSTYRPCININKLYRIYYNKEVMVMGSTVQ